MQVLGVHHVALQVRALAPMLAFYTEVLGLRVLEEHHGSDGQLRSVWLGLPGAFLALETVAGEVPARGPFRNQAPGLFLLALRISANERSQLRAELERARVTVEHETRWTLYLRDPEGNRVALSHHPEAADTAD